jgi:prolipoprotein diacylglyceryltransferase
LAGAFRFLLEFVRVNVRVLGPFTVAHVFALLVVLLGVVILSSGTRQVSRTRQVSGTRQG